MSFTPKYLRNVSFSTLLALALALRVVLILYSEWHDRRNVLKYTDIDYHVFTDAARYLLHPSLMTESRPENIAQGPLGRIMGLGDPYHRETYRYTPLLAILMTPNIFFRPSFGKYVFSICDLVIGILLRKILRTITLPEAYPSETPRDIERRATFYAALHLFNPMVFSISTRGSSESILGVLVTGTLYLAMKPEKSQRKWDLTAVMLGLSVHWKIYPVIYGVSLVSALVQNNSDTLLSRREIWKRFLSKACIRFAFISFATFMMLNALMYIVWGYPFVFETYLYHLVRLDAAHNFSPYWYLINKAHYRTSRSRTVLTSLLDRFVLSPFSSFVPQMIFSLTYGYTNGALGSRHLPLTWFLQTTTFVTFNKVCTSQYFLWYLFIFPLLLPFLQISWRKAVTMVVQWAGVQALWLKFAYDLEFLGKDTKDILGVLGFLFFAVNNKLTSEIGRAYQYRRPLGRIGDRNGKTE